MQLHTLRELFPCPDCGVDAGENCLSVKGEPMALYIHPNRGRAARTTIDEVIQLRNWLRSNASIFREAA